MALPKSSRVFTVRSWSALSLSLLAMLAASPAWAEEKEARGKPAAKAPAPPVDAEYAAAIKEGDRAYLDKDYAKAEQAYQRAVKRRAQHPEGYARLAAAQRQQGKFDEAIETLGQGLQTSSTVTERAKLTFLQADVRERQLAFDKAKARWTAYLTSTGGGEITIDLDAPEEAPTKSAVQGESVYPATAEERIKQVEAAEKRKQVYGPVKQRIRDREVEAEAKARRAK